MSNTSDVTPYESAAPDQLALDDPITRWVEEEATAAVERLRTERKQQRLEHRATPLHLQNPEPLLRSARALGYRLEPPRVRDGAEAAYLLRGAKGERMAVSRASNGRLQLHSPGEQTRVQTLLHRYSLDRSIEHFRRMGMQVNQAALPNGEVQLEARETASIRPDGAAQVTLLVHRDGSAQLDVHGTKGRRCEEIVRQYAEAVSGTVTKTRLKNSYYERPRDQPQVRL